MKRKAHSKVNKWGNRVILLFIAIGISFIGFSQAVTNTGKEFWLGYGHHNYMEGACDGSSAGSNTMNMRIYLSNTNNTQIAHIRVSLDSSGSFPGLGYYRDYVVNPNTVIETENMPKGPVNSVNTFGNTDPNYDARLWTEAPPVGTGGEGHFRKKGIHIVSDVPIVAYAHIYGSASSGATMLLPIESWGYSYTSVNSEQTDGGFALPGCYSWMYVVAKEDSTLVEITPSVTTRLGRPAWVPFTDTLMKGQIYQLIGQADCATGIGQQLTGTRVKSISGGLGDCKAIAVFSGSSRTGGEQSFCGTTGRDNDMQQCYPQQAWGTRYLTAPFSTSNGGANLRANVFQRSVYKVAVKDPSAVVKKNGVLLSESVVSVSVIPTGVSVCPGTSVKFTALPVNGGLTPTYQWKVNNVDVAGATSATYTTDSLKNGDNVQCTIVSNATCVSSIALRTKTSTNNFVAVANKLTPVVTIFSTAESDCGSNPISFTAIPQDGGTAPTYQWIVNNVNVAGATNDTYSLGSSTPGTSVKCVMTSNEGCTITPVDTSNEMVLTANTTIVPSVSISADADVSVAICAGKLITFTALPTNGGSAPFYQWQVKRFSGGPFVNVGTNSNVYSTSTLAFADTVICILTSNAPCANPNNVATSNAITIYIGNNLTPNIQLIASSSSLCGSGTTKFFAVPVANCGTAPTYQWYINGLPIGTATIDSSFTYTGLKEFDQVKCKVQSSAACLAVNNFTPFAISMNTPGLINRSYYQYNSITADYIEADKAVMVAQYISSGNNCGGATNSDGDPEMVFLSPIDQGIKKATFYSTNLETIYSNWITIILPTAGLSSLKINNSSVFNYTYPIANKPGYSVAIKGWSALKFQWTVSCDSGFNAITYGLGSAESYAYNAGTNLNNIDGLPAYHNLPDTSGLAVMHPYSYVGSPMALRVNVSFKPTQMNWKLSYLGCSVITPCTDTLVINPVPSDSITIGVAKYYQYICPTRPAFNNQYVFNVPGTYYLPIELTAPNLDNGNCNNKETVSPEIIVKYKPSIEFTSFQPISCGVDTVRFTADTITPELYKIIKYKWQFTSNTADTSNLRNPKFFFPTPGTYPVKLSIITLYGGIADTTINVVVTAGTRPHSNFGANPNTICLGLPINFKDSTSYFPDPDFSYWDFGNGYRDTVPFTTVDRPYTYAAVGTYQVRHTLMGSTFTCLPDTVTRTVIVAPTPIITGSPVAVSPTTCGGTDGGIKLTGLQANGTYTISYTYNAVVYTVLATVNAAGVLTVPNLATGTYSNIFTFIGTCVSNVVGPVTITNPAAPAAPSAGSNTPVCANTDINLTSTPFITGGIYAWTGPNGFTSSLPNPTIPAVTVTTASGGTYYVTVKVNNCLSAAGSTVVQVNNIPVIGSVTKTDPTACATPTGTITLKSLLPNTAYVVKYTFASVVQTVNITSTASGDVVITGLVAGTYSNINVTLGVCASTNAAPVTLVDPNPPATPVASPLVTTICAGGTVNFSATSSTTGVTFEWTGPSYTATGANPSITNATTGATGNYTVVAKLNGCTSLSSNAVSVVVNPIPATPNITSNSPICAGTTLNLTSSGVTGTATYNWIGANSFTSSSPNPSITNATVAATGNYTLSVTQNGCTSNTSQPLPVTVNAVPSLGSPTLTNTANCATATGSINFTGLIANTVYSVKYSYNSTVQNVTITTSSTGALVIPNLTAGSYTNISVTLNACESNTIAGPYTIQDPTPPAAPTLVSNNSPICSGNSIVLTASSSVSGGVITWTSPSGTTATGSTLTVPTAAVTDAGTYNVKVVLNGCNSSSVPANVVVKPTPIITNPTSINPSNCGSATGSITFNVSTPNTLYTIAYKKNSNSITAGITSDASGNITIGNLFSATYSNITVTLNGCTSAAFGPFILSDPNPPAVPSATSNSGLCEGNTLTLSATSTTAGSSFSWTGPNSFTSNLAAPTKPNATVADAGTYNVTATLNNCVSAPFPINVVIYATPVIGNNPTKINPTDCGGSNGSITLSGLVANTSYTVNYTKNTVAQTATITSNGTGALTIPSLAAGVYAGISVTIATCPSNTVGPVTLTDPLPPVTPSIAGNGTLCEGSPLSLVASSNAGSTFAWTSTTGYTATGNTASITATTVANSGTYTVTATLNSCTSSATKVVSVSPFPVAKFDTSKFVCMPGNAVYFTNLSTVPSNGSISYIWDFGDATPTSTAISPSHVYGSIGAVPYIITLTATFNGCSNSISQPFGSFYDKPIANFKTDKDTICQGATTVFTDLSTAPNSTIKTWSWSFGYGNATDVSKSPTYKYAFPGDYVVTLTVKNTQGCSSDAYTKPIKVYLQPLVDAGQSFIVPQGTTVVLNPTVNDSTTVTYAWTPAADFVNPNILRPSLVVNKNQKYTLTATGEGQCKAFDTLSVVALKKLTIPNAFSPNGDGINDKWDITNLRDYSFATVEVFNRNGQLLYKSYGYSNSWDGTYNGKPLPIGTYYYIIDFKNVFPKMSGYVVILR